MRKYLTGLGILLGLAAAFAGTDTTTAPAVRDPSTRSGQANSPQPRGRRKHKDWDWRQAAAEIAERDAAMAVLSAEQIAEQVLSNSGAASRCACVVFIRKTTAMPNGETLRKELIARIMRQCKAAQKNGRSLHDLSGQVDCLGALKARKEILELLEAEQAWSCHGGPNLAMALAYCGNPEDVPTLIGLADREGEGCAGAVNAALWKLTAQSLPLKNHKTDKQAWQQWWAANQARLPLPATRPAEGSLKIGKEHPGGLRIESCPADNAKK